MIEDKIEIKEIVLQIGDKEIKLPIESARRLSDSLKKLFVDPVIQHYPVYYWRFDQNPLSPWKIYGDFPTYIGTSTQPVCSVSCEVK